MTETFKKGTLREGLFFKDVFKASLKLRLASVVANIKFVDDKNTHCFAHVCVMWQIVINSPCHQQLLFNNSNTCWS